MTSTIERPAISAVEAWKEYADDIEYAVKNGYLDDYIKSIARECFSRRDAIKGGSKTPYLDRFPTSHLVNTNVTIAGDDKCDYLGGCELREGHRGPHTQGLTSASDPTQVPGAVGKNGQSLKRRVGRRPVDVTFRFTDGRLYNRSEVKGHVLPYGSSHPHLYVKVVGVGPKAAKVVFVDANGKSVTDPNSVPDKYRMANPNKNGEVIVKDPIWFGLAFITPIVLKLTPVSESE